MLRQQLPGERFAEYQVVDSPVRRSTYHSNTAAATVVVSSALCYNLLLASMRCIRQHTAAAAAKGLFPTLSKCAHSSEAETTASVHVSVCAAVLTGTESTGAESEGEPRA